jgi:hypothetical protein
MVLTEEKTLFQHMTSLSGCGVADHFDCEFDGNPNPIKSGGFFYDSRTFDRYGVGFVEAVEFRNHEGSLVVRRVLYRPANGSSLAIGTSYPDVKEFDFKSWSEWRIWRNVSDWLTELGN